MLNGHMRVSDRDPTERIAQLEMKNDDLQDSLHRSRETINELTRERDELLKTVQHLHNNVHHLRSSTANLCTFLMHMIGAVFCPRRRRSLSQDE